MEQINIPGQFFPSDQETDEGEAICKNCGNTISAHKSVKCPKKIIDEQPKAKYKNRWKRKR